MLNLIKNEYAKIFLKKTTYIMLGCCLFVAVGLSLLINSSNNESHDYFYENATFAEQMSYLKNSENIYDKLDYAEYSIYDSLGYQYYSEVPNWISSAAYDAIYNHYVYVIISESDNISKAELELGIALDDMDLDLDYERKISQDFINAIKAKDYTIYYKTYLSHLDYLKENNVPYSERDYEYFSYLIEKNINPETDEAMLEDINYYLYSKNNYENLIQAQKEGQNISDYEIEKQKKSYIIYKYIIDNDIENYLTEPVESDTEPTSRNKLIAALTSNTNVCAMAGIFVMIIAAGIIANEFSNGTIKFLLINPVKRAKIFWSKYITCISLFIFTLVSFFIIYFLFCLLICGTNGLDGVYISYADGVACEESIMMYSIKQYSLSAISLITSITLAFTISSLLNSTALAIAISLVIEFAGSAITLFLYELGHDWARYLIFANTDLAGISKGMGVFPGQTLCFSVITIIIYMVIFMLTAYDGFTKKEV